MTRVSALPALVASLLIATVSCGGSNNPRQLVSMTLTPATAQISAPDGQVQFSASGQYNRSPLTGQVQPALWDIYEPQSSPGNPTITQSGLAQCESNSGTFGVTAYAIADPDTAQTQQNLLHATKVVLGTASLTCP